MAFLFFIGVNVALANGSVKETHFSTSISEATGIVRVIVAVFGGLIGILGIILAFRGIGGTADVSMSVSGHGNLSIKRISQGVVITLIGAAILIGAVYFLPEKKIESLITGKDITVETEAGKKRVIMKK
jgi:hypothetical protein